MHTSDPTSNDKEQPENIIFNGGNLAVSSDLDVIECSSSDGQDDNQYEVHDDDPCIDNENGDDDNYNDNGDDDDTGLLNLDHTVSAFRSLKKNYKNIYTIMNECI
jgi:hypothetical protein